MGHADLIGDLAERAVRVALAAEDLDGGVEDLTATGDRLGARTRLAALLDMHSAAPPVARHRNVVYSQFAKTHLLTSKLLHVDLDC